MEADQKPSSLNWREGLPHSSGIPHEVRDRIQQVTAEVEGKTAQETAVFVSQVLLPELTGDDIEILAAEALITAGQEGTWTPIPRTPSEATTTRSGQRRSEAEMRAINQGFFTPAPENPQTIIPTPVFAAALIDRANGNSNITFLPTP